ncbi:MAG TPA: aldo/keto reductase [Bryobacteraceae bacterium]|jgi:aryl-alcohol dehydrogenase-like predicted oxidoreductase|nr:aldo/keto reductase [Bryobacteraceae bacterium]
MQTRLLPHTDLTVSRACFGVMTFGGQTDEPTARRIVDICMDRGINFFDTANAYNKGQSEVILGNVLKGRRDRVILASKVGMKTGEPAGVSPLSRKSILANIEGSLRRLQTDYLDLYYLHLPDYEAPIDETLAALDELVRAGKVRYPATSNFAAWQVCQALWISEKSGYKPPYVSQPMYNLLARGIEQEYLPFCRAFGVSTIVYNPLAGGLLTGKQHRERPLPGTRFDANQMYLDRYWHPAYFDAVDELQKIAAQAGRSLIDLSLNWLLYHTVTDCVILGASKIEQIEQNLDVWERGPLSQETVAALDCVWQKLRGVTPKYNR